MQVNESTLKGHYRPSMDPVGSFTEFIQSCSWCRT